MILFLGGVLFLAPLLSFLADPVPGHDVQRIIQIAVLVLAAGVVAYRMAWSAPSGLLDRMYGCRNTVLIQLLLSICVLTGAVAVLHAERPLWSLREAGLYLGLLGLVMAIACDDVVAANKRYCWAVLLGIGPYVVFVCSLIAAVLVSHEALIRQAIFVGYSNFRFFNHVQTIAIPLLATVCATSLLPPWARRAAFIVLVAAFALMYFSAARATFGAMCTGAIAVAIVAPRQAKRWLMNLTVAAVLGALMYLLLFEGLLRLTQSGIDVSTVDLLANGRSIDLRQYLWRIAFGDFMESPWWGIGPMHFAHRFNGEAAHPHNALLQLLAEWGLPFTFAIVSLAGIALYRLVSRLRLESPGERATIGVGVTCASIAIAADGMLSGNFVMPLSQLWIAMTAGWWVCWMRELNPPRESASAMTGVRRLALGVWLVVASQIALVYLTVPEALRLKQKLAVASAELRSDHFSPRFWSDGWF